MAPNPTAHPTDDQLRAFVHGKLTVVAANTVYRHIEQCPACSQRGMDIEPDTFIQKVAELAGRSSASSSDQRKLPKDFAADASLIDVPTELLSLSQYQIHAVLGRGGMGVVYKAYNAPMARWEVLKVVKQDLLTKSGMTDRFLQEIRSAAKLNHPNIVAAHAAHILDSMLVFAMEYIDGQDLAETVKSSGPLPVRMACIYIRQAALGLQHAHEKGMVHRDIKPANLMLTREGDRNQKHIIKILDFGLAKTTALVDVDVTVGEGSHANRDLTGYGRQMGTPDYMAPEQWIDAASAKITADIYSLGGTFMFLLTGAPPYQVRERVNRDRALKELEALHMGVEALPVTLRRPDVPSELAAVIAKMMAKDHTKRYQTPLEVAKALEPFVKTAISPVILPPIASPNAPTITSGSTVPPLPNSHVTPYPTTVVSPNTAIDPVVEVASPLEMMMVAEAPIPLPKRRAPTGEGFPGLVAGLLGILVVFVLGSIIWFGILRTKPPQVPTGNTPGNAASTPTSRAMVKPATPIQRKPMPKVYFDALETVQHYQVQDVTKTFIVPGSGQHEKFVVDGKLEIPEEGACEIQLGDTKLIVNAKTDSIVVQSDFDRKQVPHAISADGKTFQFTAAVTNAYLQFWMNGGIPVWDNQFPDEIRGPLTVQLTGNGVKVVALKYASLDPPSRPSPPTPTKPPAPKPAIRPAPTKPAPKPPNTRANGL